MNHTLQEIHKKLDNYFIVGNFYLSDIRNIPQESDYRDNKRLSYIRHHSRSKKIYFLHKKYLDHFLDSDIVIYNFYSLEDKKIHHIDLLELNEALAFRMIKNIIL